MKVNAFVSLYNVKTKHIELDRPTIINIIKDLIKPINYLPYDKKIELIEHVIQDNVNTQYPTAMRYRSFIIFLIRAYTNLEMDEKGFDILMENGMLDLILSIFESEYKICNTLLQMCLDDFESR